MAPSKLVQFAVVMTGILVCSKPVTPRREHAVGVRTHVAGGSHLRGERRESDRENERLIAMARKQREKDPRPHPQPPRASQARRVAGVIVGPGSVVPGPLEPSLSRDSSRTSERFEILSPVVDSSHEH